MTRRHALGVAGVALLACCASAVGYCVVTRATGAARSEPPRLVITTRAPGMSAEAVEYEVTAQIERAIGGVSGLVGVESASERESSVVRLTFASGPALPDHRAETFAKLSELPRLLPTHAEVPILAEGNRAVRLHYTIESTQLSGGSLRALSDGVVRDAFARLPGVGAVMTCGGLVERAEVIVDAARMVSLGVSLSAVIAAVRAASLQGGLPEVGAAPIAGREGPAVRISDVATVTIGHAPAPCTAGRGEADNVVLGVVELQRGADVAVTLPVIATRLSELAAQSLPEGVLVRPLDFSSSPSDVARVHASSLRVSLAAPADARHSAIADAVRRVPEVSDVVIRRGKLAADDVIARSGDRELLVRIDPQAGRPLRDVAAEIAGHLTAIPGARYDFSATAGPLPRDLRALSVRISGADLAELRATADQVVGLLQGIRGASGVGVAGADMEPRSSMVIDRSKLAEVGLSAAEVALYLEAATGGHRAGGLHEGKRRLDLVVRLLPSGAGAEEDLQRLVIQGPGRAPVPLSSLVKLEARSEPAVIFRARGARFVEVRLDVRGRDPDDFLREARRHLDEQARLPAGYSLEWTGDLP